MDRYKTVNLPEGTGEHTPGERLAAAALVAAVVFLALYFPDRDDGSGAVLGGVFAFASVVKTTTAGLALGWIFWRKGLPYSIASHCTANAIHLLAAPWLF